MEYSEIIKEINQMYDEDFNMDSFRYLGILDKRIKEIAYKEDLSDVEKEYNYHAVNSYLEEFAFAKLKDKLGYEDEVIYKIMKYISYADAIEEIFVIDGYVMVKAVTNVNINERKSFFIPEDGFYDISSANFNDSNNSLILKELIITGINNILNDNLDIKKPLIINGNGDAIYNKKNINIFINRKMSDLAKINAMDNNEIIKVLVRSSFDKIDYFDMKLHNGYLVTYQNEYPVNKVSSALRSVRKVKRK